MTRSELKYILLIIIIFISACIETDIYLPTFPDMMKYFSVSEEVIQSLLTWNFFGICLSGLFYGPISDSIGRKKPLIFALALFFIGSLLTIFAKSFDLMLWGRLLQGLGSGGCFTLGTAIIFDAFKAEKAIRAINQINFIAPFIMAAAPVVGGYLNHFYGFRSNFVTIAIFVFMSLAICFFFLEETLVKEKRAPLELKKVLGDFKKAFQSLPFWQLTLVVSLPFAGYLAFLSTSSVLFVLEFGVSKQTFPYLQASILVVWLIASLTCSQAIKRCGGFKIKVAGTALIVMGALGLFVTALFQPKNPYLLTAFMILYTFGANWAQGLYFPESMEILPDIKGVTSSLLTSTRLLIAAMVVGVTSKFYDASIFPVAIMIMGIVSITLLIVILYERKQITQSASSAIKGFET